MNDGRMHEHVLSRNRADYRDTVVLYETESRRTKIETCEKVKTTATAELHLYGRTSSVSSGLYKCP